MKRSLLGLCTVGLILLGSCKKNDKGKGTSPGPGNPGNPGNPTLPASYWKINDSVYKVDVATGNSDQLAACNSCFTFANSCTVWFYTFPTTNGSYQIVDGDGPLGGPGNVRLTIKEGSKRYSSAGTDNVKATVTVAAGKITVIIPPTKIRNSDDSALFSAKIIQTN